jgi:hypothetical protein
VNIIFIIKNTKKRPMTFSAKNKVHYLLNRAIKEDHHIRNNMNASEQKLKLIFNEVWYA